MSGDGIGRWLVSAQPVALAFPDSGLGKMLAMAGGQALGQAELPIWLLLVVFILVTLWTVMLIVWVALGVPLGPRGPLVYVPA